jgi:uncharacterized protein with HEPN domain
MKSDAVYLQHIPDAIHNIDEYFDVDLVALWDLAQTSLPGFKEQVASILKELA